MILSLNAYSTVDPVLQSLRSLSARGRHTEADRLARIEKRRCLAAHGHLFLALRAEIAVGLGRFTAALEWANAAMKRIGVVEARQAGFEGLKIKALLGLGRFRDAERLLESSHGSREVGGADLRLYRAQVALHSGRLEEAESEASAACARAEVTRQRRLLVEGLLLRARTAREAGKADSARNDLDRAHRLSGGLRDANALATVLSDRADLMAHSGAWAEADRDAGQAGRIFARTLSPHEHLSAGRCSGLLGLARGDMDAALPSIERAADMARRGFGAAACRAEIELLRADAQLAARDPEGALDRATAALSVFRDARDPGGLARAHVRRSTAALSGSNVALALREARIAGSIAGAGSVAESLADLALGRVLLRRDPSAAAAPFDRAARNRGLYPPLRSVAHLGVALAGGASLITDSVRESLQAIEAFGDRRILGIVQADLKEMFGVEIFAEAPPQHVLAVPVAELRDCAEVGREFLPGLVGASEVVRKLSEQIRRVAPTDLPVSIYGETGTGKEKVARAVHLFSGRSMKEFVAFNAASLSDELFESELFGHVRGSFTGAHADRPGLVEKARGGTLFIDEIADLSLRAQVRLLRFIQEGTYRRVGENQERRAEVRIVVAANRPLEDLVAAGSFRKDLLERLKGVCVTVPPLRDRGQDVVHLARHFIARASDGASRLSASSEAQLRDHEWSGNVRELEMEMRRAVVLADGPTIEWRKPARASSPTAIESPRLDPPMESLHQALGEFERKFLKEALARCHERMEAARILGISRQALHQKVLRYGL